MRETSANGVIGAQITGQTSPPGRLSTEWRGGVSWLNKGWS